MLFNHVNLPSLKKFLYPFGADTNVPMPHIVTQNTVSFLINTREIMASRILNQPLTPQVTLDKSLSLLACQFPRL